VEVTPPQESIKGFNGFYQSGMDAFCPSSPTGLSEPRHPKNRANPVECQGVKKNLMENIALPTEFRDGLLTHLNQTTWKLRSEALK
jgi:hypothetical protein